MCKPFRKPIYTYGFPGNLQAMRLPLPLLLVLVFSSAAAVDSIAGTEVALRGSGRLSWMWYDIYDVELHLPSGASVDPSTQPCRLTFRYLRAFTAAELAKATTSTVRERMPGTAREEVEQGLAAINALWPAVAKGDVLVLTAVPGKGIGVACNGRELGVVPGAIFAQVLFSIWLGDDPVDSGLKQRLLAQR